MIVVLLAVAGVNSHLLYFIHGEHHMKASKLFYGYLCLVFVAFGMLVARDGSILSSAKATMVLVAAYAFPLFLSMLIYRIFFHRLRSFPGPFLARTSKFWHVYHVRRSLNHQLMQLLYKKYGPFVRTGKLTAQLIFLSILNRTC